MAKKHKLKISRSTLIFLAVMLLTSLCFFSASYFFNKNADIYLILIPYFVVSTIFWISQPLKTWKKPVVIVATTLLCSLLSIFLMISTLFLPGSHNPEYIEHEICNPAIAKYYGAKNTAYLPDRAFDMSSNGSYNRVYAQRMECVENDLKGKGPIFSENPPGFAPADPTANWKTYTDSKFGYSIKYPSELFFNCKKDGFTLFKGVEDTCALGETPTDFYIQAVGSSTSYSENNECITVNKQNISIGNNIPATQYTYTRTPVEGSCQKYNGYLKSVHYEVLNRNIIMDIYMFEKDDPIKNQILSTFQLKSNSTISPYSNQEHIDFNGWKIRVDRVGEGEVCEGRVGLNDYDIAKCNTGLKCQFRQGTAQDAPGTCVKE